MNLVTWSPFRDMATFHNRIYQFLDDAFAPSQSLIEWHPVVDIYDNEANVVIQADLPGLRKEDINIDVAGRVLTIKGERVVSNDTKIENYYRRERSHGKFQRSFTLPEDLELDQITAEFKDGVLKVTVPKPQEVKPKQIRVH